MRVLWRLVLAAAACVAAGGFFASFDNVLGFLAPFFDRFYEHRSKAPEGRSIGADSHLKHTVHEDELFGKGYAYAAAGHLTSEHRSLEKVFEELQARSLVLGESV